MDIGGGSHIALQQVDPSKLDSMEVKDFRVLPLRFDSQGQRRAEFADAVSHMHQVEMPGGKLQLAGPASALEVGVGKRGQIRLRFFD